MAEPTGLEKVANNTIAIVVARYIVPPLLAVIGFFMMTTLGDVKETLKVLDHKIESRFEESRKSFWEAQGILARNQADMNVKIGVLGEKTDSLTRRVERVETTRP